MAHRTLSRLLLTAFGVSLLAAAGQLGLAFGFGIVRLTGAFSGATLNQWPAQLVWVGWFAANAAVIGAVFTERMARHDRQLDGTARRLAVAGSAALGATVVAPLCMQQARSAELITADPVWAVAICAVLGAVIGAGAALAVLVRPPFAWNMAAMAAAMWLISLLSVIPSLGEHGPLTPVRLGVLEPAWLPANTAQQLALLILPIVTLLAGLASAAVARRRGHPPSTSAPSGVAGPVLVAFAYLAAGPGNPVDRYQLTPYYGALIAFAVGALGSAAAALLPWPLTTRPESGDQAIQPTAILQPLPATPALPTSPSRPTGPHPPATDSPPHWQWPDQQTSPAATRAEAADPATVSTPGRSALPEQPTSTATGTSPAPVVPEPADEPAAPREPASPKPATSADEPVAADETATADGTATADEAAVTGRAEPAVDPAPVGDGSDLSPLGRVAWSPPPATSPAKAPAPRRTRQPQTSTTAARTKQPHEQQPASPTSASLVTPDTGTPSDHSAAGHDEPTGHADVPFSPAADGNTSPLWSPATNVSDSGGSNPDSPEQPVAGAGAGEAATEVRPESTPRPRRRLTLPELKSARNTFEPTRAASRPPADDTATTTPALRPGTADPTGAETTPPQPGETDSGAPSGPESAESPGLDPSARSGVDPRTTAREVSAAFATAATVSRDPAATVRDLSAAFTKPPAVDPTDLQQVGDRDKGLRGLFRRGKSRPDNTVDGEEPLPAQDEEYVDWVTGLGRPAADDEPAPKKSRRSLRSTGRHHRD